MTNLLHDEIIGVETPQGGRKVTLPELLALLSRGQVEAYTGQRPHQADVWHVFTVQLAAGILARRPGTAAHAPPDDPVFWRDGLLGLAGGNAHAWELVVDDVTQPAFFQHPLSGPEELEKDFKPKEPKATTPDELDVLVTAKDHDVKQARLPADDLEAWMYALVTYQTTSGYLGAGNYGIVRMNGGFASRPIVSMVSSLRPAERFREEVSALCAHRPALLRSAFGYKPDGVVLTWVKPWDRAGHQWLIHDLDPFFIEAARVVRLIRKGKGVVALGAPTKARQLGPKALENGDVGDPWTPIQTDNKKKGRAALSITGEGWTPELICGLLFEQGYELTPLQRPKPAPSTQWFFGCALSRGQGTTDGFHRIVLPVPPKAGRLLLDKGKRDRLAAFAQELQKDARDMEAALRSALTALIEGGPENLDFKADAVKAWVNRRMSVFRGRWQDQFFPVLWMGVDVGEEAAREEWIGHLTALSRSVLDEASQALPSPRARQYRAKSLATGLFWGKLRKEGLLIREVDDDRSAIP